MEVIYIVVFVLILLLIISFMGHIVIQPPPSLPENDSGYDSDNTPVVITPSCSHSPFGCCPDGETARVDSYGSNCIPIPGPPGSQGCSVSPYGCCSDGTTYRHNSTDSTCPLTINSPPSRFMPTSGPTSGPTPAPTSAPGSTCQGSQYGCCPDNITALVDSYGSNCLNPSPYASLNSYSSSTFPYPSSRSNTYYPSAASATTASATTASATTASTTSSTGLTALVAPASSSNLTNYPTSYTLTIIPNTSTSTPASSLATTSVSTPALTPTSTSH